MEISIPAYIVCPICKSTNLSTQTEGMLFKKNVLTCNGCHTVMEQSGKGDKAIFKVRGVGDEYSNANILLQGKSFSIQELSTHNISVVSDEQLAEFSQGNLENLTVQMSGDLDRDIILKKDERIVFWLGPIDYLEERKKKVSGGAAGFSFRVTKGVWYRTMKINSQYEDTLTMQDSGILILTNKRYIFMGGGKNIDQPLTALTAINPFADGVSFVRSGKQRTEFFRGNYHWPLISSIIIGLVKNANQAS